MIILDTHIWVRWSCNDLSNSITSRIERASSVCVSAISCWEIAYLAKRGRLDLGIPLKEWFHEALDQSGVVLGVFQKPNCAWFRHGSKFIVNH